MVEIGKAQFDTKCTTVCMRMFCTYRSVKLSDTFSDGGVVLSDENDTDHKMPPVLTFSQLTTPTFAVGGQTKSFRQFASSPDVLTLPWLHISIQFRNGCADSVSFSLRTVFNSEVE